MTNATASTQPDRYANFMAIPRSLIGELSERPRKPGCGRFDRDFRESLESFPEKAGTAYGAGVSDNRPQGSVEIFS